MHLRGWSATDCTSIIFPFVVLPGHFVLKGPLARLWTSSQHQRRLGGTASWNLGGFSELPGLAGICSAFHSINCYFVSDELKLYTRSLVDESRARVCSNTAYCGGLPIHCDGEIASGFKSLKHRHPIIPFQDTEFPGVVARPIGNFTTTTDYLYQTMRCNVDLLKIIQIGLTLSDANGNRPPDVCTWQFNFHFSLKYVLAVLLTSRY